MFKLLKITIPCFGYLCTKNPTHMNCYLQFDSHHPMHQKLAVARSLYNRIDTCISKLSEQQIHLDFTKEILMPNGFPARYACLHSYQTLDKLLNYLNLHTFISFKALPDIKGVSDKIK